LTCDQNAYMSKINVKQEDNSGEREDQRVKTDMLRSIGKQSGKSDVHSIARNTLSYLYW